MIYKKYVKITLLILVVITILFLSFKGIFIYRYQPLARAAKPVSWNSEYYDYNGIYHCHSIYSDGSGTVEEIMEAANAAGLTFLILTDHDTRKSINDGKEGWYDGCLLLVGEEISIFAGHYVGLDIPPTAFKFSPQTQATIDDVNELGGVGIIAHPFSLSNYRWKDWSVEGFQGMELINTDTQWKDEPFYRLAWLLLTYKLNPVYAILNTLDYPSPNMTKWDQLTKERHIIGIAGSDAHQNVHLFGETNLKFPRYKDIFSVTHVHILTSKPITKQLEVDKDTFYSALKKGNLYICHEGLAESNGFIFQAQCQEKKAIMGDTLFFQGYSDFTIAHSFPAESEIILIKDGIQIAKSSRKRLIYRTHEPGVYRVEVWPNKRYLPKGKNYPWIISNPIYLRDKKYIEKDTLRKNTNKTIPLSNQCQFILQDFEQFPLKSSFSFEYDSSSFIDEKNIIAYDTPIENSNKALIINFRLGSIDKQKKEVWCALGDRKRRDLSNFTGISFYTKGDQTYRLAFNLREEDADGGKEKIEEWVTTIKIRPKWEHKYILFKDLYLASKNTNGKKELNKVKGLFFILNQDNTQPATEGKIWLDEICLF